MQESSRDDIKYRMGEVYIFTTRKGNKFHRIKVVLIAGIAFGIASLLYTFNPADSFLYAPALSMR